MVIFEISDPHMHQNAQFKKNYRGSMPPNPPTRAHGFATCKFPNLKKKFLPPQVVPNPGYVPGECTRDFDHNVKYSDL